MARVKQHATDAFGNCSICGTTAMQIAKGYGCVWRDVPDARHSEMAPEPARRIPACEDTDEIRAGLSRLKAETDERLNRPATPET